MFSPRRRPLLLVADRLRALRLSLNTPVLSTPELPAGPARAAIAVHQEGSRTCFTVAVRSLRDGVSVLYELEGEEPRDEGALEVAFEATLSFAESMGFLFDDEVLVDRSPETLRRAVASLRELVAPPAPGEDEILLEETVEADAATARREVGAAAPRAPGAGDARPGRVALTKFRPGAGAGGPGGRAAGPGGRAAQAARPGATAPPGAARLGRVRPIRVKAAAPAAAGPPPPSPLLRLLSAF